mgnify:CR=1 FL=1
METLFDDKLNPKAFGGGTYEPDKDYERLTQELGMVEALMGDQVWRTSQEVADTLGLLQDTAGARLRDLRKPEYGQYPCISRRREGQRCYEYQLGERGEGIPKSMPLVNENTYLKDEVERLKNELRRAQLQLDSGHCVRCMKYLSD